MFRNAENRILEESRRGNPQENFTHTNCQLPPIEELATFFSGFFVSKCKKLINCFVYKGTPLIFMPLLSGKDCRDRKNEFSHFQILFSVNYKLCGLLGVGRLVRWAVHLQCLFFRQVKWTNNAVVERAIWVYNDYLILSRITIVSPQKDVASF